MARIPSPRKISPLPSFRSSTSRAKERSAMTHSLRLRPRWRADRVAGYRNDRGHDFVLCKLRACRIDGHHLDVGVTEEDLFDLMRRDILAAAADRILEAVHKAEVAVLVTDDPVAGVEPEVSPGLDSLLGHSEITGRKCERLVGAEHELAGLAGGDFDVVGIDDARLETVDDTPHRPRLLRRRRCADHEVGFGRPVTFEQRNAGAGG